MIFPTQYSEILLLLENINPQKYAYSRNYTDGAVTKLSPYISRGVISVKTVFDFLVSKGMKPNENLKFVQQMAWREYFQRVWQNKNIDENLKNEVHSLDFKMPLSILEAKTGISVIDKSIVNFYETGYLHNHFRLYIASLVCNVSKSDWKMGAKWMHYYLLDADGASNNCSWQWVSGNFSSKKYVANQDNINTYTNSFQKNTFLDIEYEDFENLKVPEVLKDKVNFEYETILPKSDIFELKSNLPTLIYNFYNLDPEWRKSENANRVLLLEKSHFVKYPISEKSVNFMLELSKNIPNIKIMVAEFSELKLISDNLIFKEHPAFDYYTGTKDARDWIFKDVNQYYPSFFSFWKNCEPKL